MRSRRRLTIIGSSTVGIAFLAISTWPAPHPTRSEASPALETAAAQVRLEPASSGVSIAQDRLEAEARQAAGTMIVAEQARREAAAAQARREAVAQARREAAAQRAARASRDAARPRPVTAAAGAPAGADDIWAKLRRCEAGGNYTRNSGNGYYGAYQFSAATWRSLGYPGLPHQAPPEVQDEAARKLQRRSGWGQWPACSRRIGAR
jgi:hypothetical protein